MTSPGTNLGTVSYEIQPDVDLAAFARDAKIAGAAFGKQYSDAANAAVKKAMQVDTKGLFGIRDAGDQIKAFQGVQRALSAARGEATRFDAALRAEHDSFISWAKGSTTSAVTSIADALAGGTRAARTELSSLAREAVSTHGILSRAQADADAKMVRGTASAYDEVSRIVRGHIAERNADADFLRRSTASAATELDQQYGRSIGILSKGFSDLRAASATTTTGVSTDWKNLFPALQADAGRMFSAIGTGFSTVGTGVRGLGSVFGATITGVGSVASNVASGFARVGSSMWSAMNRASDAVRSLGSHLGIASFQMGILGGALTAFVTGPLALAGAAIGKWGASTAMNLEDAQVGLKALLPPGYDVEALTKRLSDLAIASPVFAVDELFDFTRKLVGAGVEAGRAEPLLDSLNKIFITYGVTGEKASKALLGVSQVFSKGKVSSEELTQQIGEQIPIWHLLSEASGMTQAELRELTKEGGFSADMFAELITKAGGLPSVMAGAAGGVSTLRAQISIAKEEFQQMLATEILRFFPEIKNSLNALQPIFQIFATFVVSQIPAVINLFGQLVGKILELKGLYDGLTPAQQAFIEKMALVVVAVGPALIVLGGLTTALSTILGFASMILNPWGLLVAALGGGLLYLYKSSEDFRLSIESFRSSFSAALGAEMPAAVQRLRDAVNNELVPAFRALAASLGFNTFQEFGSWLGGSFASASVGGVNFLTGAVRGLASGMQFLSEKMPTIKQHLSEFGGKLEYLKGKWDDLSGAQRTALTLLAGGAVAGAIGAGGPVSFVRDAGGAVGGVLGAIGALGPAGVLASAGLGLVAAGFVSAYTENDVFKGKVDGMVRGFRDGFREDVLPQLKELWTSIVGGDGKKGLVPAIADLLITLGGGTPQEAGRSFAAGLGYAVGGIRSFVDEVVPLIEGFGEAWKNLIRASASGMSTISKIYNGFVDLNSKVGWALTGGKAQPKIADEQLNYFDALAAGASMNDALMNFSDYRASLEFYRTLNDARSRGGQRLASGGYFSGRGTSKSDSNLAWLSNGEFVANAAATSQYRSTLEAINSGAPPRVVMATLPAIPGSRSTSDPVEQQLYVTVLLDGQPIVERAQAVVDANNRAVINLNRSARTVS